MTLAHRNFKRHSNPSIIYVFDFSCTGTFLTRFPILLPNMILSVCYMFLIIGISCVNYDPDGDDSNEALRYLFRLLHGFFAFAFHIDSRSGFLVVFSKCTKF